MIKKYTLFLRNDRSIWEVAGWFLTGWLSVAAQVFLQIWDKLVVIQFHYFLTKLYCIGVTPGKKFHSFWYQTEKRTQNPQVSGMRYEIVATIIKFCPIVNVNLDLAELSRCYK